MLWQRHSVQVDGSVESGIAGLMARQLVRRFFWPVICWDVLWLPTIR